MSDYSLHSIGLLLFRRRQHDVFQKFLEDITFGLGGLAYPAHKYGVVVYENT